MKRVVLLALLLTGASSFCFAQSVEAPDPRLAQRVTLEEREITLTDLMKKLSEQTGVKLSVDQKPAQWSVRERKVVVFVKEVPLGELQLALKRLLVYSWKRLGSEGSWEYVIYQSEADRARETRLREEKLAVKEQEKATRFQRVNDYYHNAASMTPEQAQRIKESDPMAYLVATWPPAKAMFNLLSSLPPQAIQQVTDGKRCSIPVREMTPEMQGWIREFLDGINLIEPKKGGSEQNQITDEKLQTMTFDLEPIPTEMAEAGDQMLGLVEFRAPGVTRNFPIPDPEAPVAKFIGRMVTGLLEGKRPEDFENAETQAAFTRALQERRTGVLHYYSPEKPPKDPELIREIDIPVQMGRGAYQDVLKKISTDLKLSVIGDCFTSRPSGMNLGQPGISSEKMPLYQFLNAVGSNQNRTWVKDGSVILWQDTEWYIKRSWDVPQEWIAYFKSKILKDTNLLLLDDLAKMAAFSQDQVQRTIASVKELAGAAFLFQTQQKSLNFFSTLSESQKKQARSEQGLPLSRLTPKQREMAATAINESQFMVDMGFLLENGILILEEPEKPPVTDARLVFQAPDGQRAVCQIGRANQQQPKAQ